MNNTTYYTMNMNMNNHVSPAWQPEGATNSKIIQDSNITSNWKYRQYIQKNASQIMKYNSMEAISASGNNPYYTNQGQSQSTSNIPQLYNSLHSQSVNQDISQDSDLKREFLNKQRLSARMISPSIPTNKF